MLIFKVEVKVEKDWENKIDEIEKTRLKRKIVKLFHCCYCITMKQLTFLNNELF